MQRPNRLAYKRKQLERTRYDMRKEATAVNKTVNPMTPSQSKKQLAALNFLYDSGIPELFTAEQFQKAQQRISAALNEWLN